MTENLIERFAAYPKDEDAATAENVYRYLLVSAQLAHLRSQRAFDAYAGVAREDPAHVPLRDAYITHAGLFVSSWSTLHLLRHILGPSCDGSGAIEAESPDQVAREMWIGWEDGGGPAEVLWDWLVEAGFAPEEIEVEFEKVTKAAAT